MATDYRDESEFASKDHSIAEIAGAIRHKKYGRDVREAIAQGFEKINTELVRIDQKNRKLQKALELSDDDLNNLF